MKFVILSGTGVVEFRETADSAKEALERVLRLMKLRRPSVRVENELGHDISFFQLKDAAASEQSADDLNAARALTGAPSEASVAGPRDPLTKKPRR
jgi:hypothetical protein